MWEYDESSTDKQLWAEFYQFVSCIAIMTVGAFIVAWLA